MKTYNAILNNLFIGIQKTSNDNELITKPTAFEGLESYLYFREIPETSEHFIMASPEILNSLHLSKEKAWKIAETNTFSKTTVMSMRDIFLDGLKQLGKVPDEIPDTIDDSMYIVSNCFHWLGASAILDKEALTELAKHLHTNKFIVLPSSVHEMLVIPYTEESDLTEFSNIVKEVNVTQVDENEQLTDRAYVIAV